MNKLKAYNERYALIKRGHKDAVTLERIGGNFVRIIKLEEKS